MFFTKINGYPSRVVHDSLKKVEITIQKEQRLDETINRIENASSTSSDKNTQQEEIFPYICLPYKGKEGENIISTFKKRISKILPAKIKPRIVFKGKKLGSFFSLKDPIKRAHQTNLVYGYSHDGNPDQIQYVGETKVRFETRTHEHAVSDKQSSIYKHATTHNYSIEKDNFKVLESGFDKVVDRKIAESLYIKEFEPSLNEQIQSYTLKLFN